MATTKTLGEFLHWYRWNKACLYQKEIAEQMGITRRTYIKLENDQTASISKSTVEKIAKFTHKTPAQIIKLFENSQAKVNSKEKAE